MEKMSHALAHRAFDGLRDAFLEMNLNFERRTVREAEMFVLTAKAPNGAEKVLLSSEDVEPFLAGIEFLRNVNGNWVQIEQDLAKGVKFWKIW